jgi:hypothetical protein
MIETREFGSSERESYVYGKNRGSLSDIKLQPSLRELASCAVLTTEPVFNRPEYHATLGLGLTQNFRMSCPEFKRVIPRLTSDWTVPNSAATMGPWSLEFGVGNCGLRSRRYPSFRW